jgi:hypothetical protein
MSTKSNNTSSNARLINKIYIHYDKKYTKVQIRKCALHTSKVHNVSIDTVHETIDEMNGIKALEKTLYELELPKSVNLQNEIQFLPKEVRDLIFDMVKDDKTYKALLEVSASVNKKQTLHKHKHFNQLWTLINKYPKKKWDWESILKNPNTSQEKIMKFIEDHSKNGILEHDYWVYILQNPNLAETIIGNVPSREYFNYAAMTYPFIFKYVDKYPKEDWDGELLSQNPHLTIEFVKSHPKIDWEMSWVSANKNISLQDVDNNPDVDWDYSEGLSANPNVTPKYIEENIDKSWDWMELSSNPHITMEFIDRHINEKWYWGAVSANKGIRLQDIEERLNNERYKWRKWIHLSTNPNMTIQFVKDHIDGFGGMEWNWAGLSQNQNITMEDIEANIDLPWVWRFVYSNPNFTVEYADKYKDRDIGHFYMMFSSNPNLTADYVSEDIKGKWNWKTISGNNFEKDESYKG